MGLPSFAFKIQMSLGSIPDQPFNSFVVSLGQVTNIPGAGVPQVYGETVSVPQGCQEN